jgi:Protein of unknown function (DUF1559)
MSIRRILRWVVIVVLATMLGLWLRDEVMKSLFLPDLRKVRETAARTQDNNNLREIAIAMHNYCGTHKTLPPAAICDKTGKPLLSWRVAILPYFSQDELYKKFKLDEPWNGPNNKKLIPLMPPAYLLCGEDREPGLTHVRVFVGRGALFDLNEGISLARIADGASNTIMMVHTVDAVTWTAPNDIEYGPMVPLPRLRASADGGFVAVLADGSVRMIQLTISDATMRALITRDGGEAIGNDVIGKDVRDDSRYRISGKDR